MFLLLKQNKYIQYYKHYLYVVHQETKYASPIPTRVCDCKTMADDITERLHKFVLTEEEKEVISIGFLDIQPSMNDCEVSLLRKLIFDKKANFNGVNNVMPLVWEIQWVCRL